MLLLLGCGTVTQAQNHRRFSVVTIGTRTFSPDFDFVVAFVSYVPPLISTPVSSP